MPAYDLILYHVPKRQCISDFLTIRNIMVGRAPDIRVHVLSAASPVPSTFWQIATEGPSLIFSFADLRLNAPDRSARMISRSLTTLEEIELMATAGVPVPETRLITPETRLDEAQWGLFTVIKPNRSMLGRCVRLVRTRDVRWTDTTALPREDPRHGQELVAQRFVDTGPYVTCYRVMTVLGRPIYCVQSTTVEKRPGTNFSGTAAFDISVADSGMARKMILSNESEIIELATSLHAALPHLPVMGVDIMREHGTGRPFVLEFNSHGLVWDLSSDIGFSQQRNNRIDFYGQFNALSTLADALIETTRYRAT